MGCAVLRRRQAWGGNFIAECCLSHIDVEIEQNVIAIPAEEFMWGNLDFDVKITVRTTIGTR